MSKTGEIMKSFLSQKTDTYTKSLYRNNLLEIVTVSFEVVAHGISDVSLYIVSQGCIIIRNLCLEWRRICVA